MTLPRLIVEIQFGRFAGRKLVVAPGAKLSVGRTPRADFAVPHDGAMAGLHFELAFDGATVKVRDRSGGQGTILDGLEVGAKNEEEDDLSVLSTSTQESAPSQKGDVPEAIASHGSWIRAGDTVFSLYLEAFTPPTRSAIEDDEDYDDEERARRAELRDVEAARLTRASAAYEHLRNVMASGPLYAVVDAARDHRIVELLHESPDETTSLYEGTRGEALVDVAPRLVQFREDSGLLQRLVTEGWERRWGVFLVSPLNFRDTRKHFRRFLMVEVEDTHKRLYFRFYDPGVMREFMPTCSVRQNAEFIGDAEAFVCEGASGEIIRFTKATSATSARATAQGLEASR